jgi:predicted Zn-ribbon and HTH transcriptional regulator
VEDRSGPKRPPGASAPAPRTATVRDALAAALRGGAASARDLSVRVGVREKDVAAHLEHLARSLPHRDERLEVTPASCIECGFAFRARERLTRPSACPRCRSTRIDPPLFRVVPAR